MLSFIVTILIVELQEYLQVGQTKAGLIINELLTNITISKIGKGKATKYLVKQ